MENEFNRRMAAGHGGITLLSRAEYNLLVEQVTEVLQRSAAGELLSTWDTELLDLYDTATVDGSIRLVVPGRTTNNFNTVRVYARADELFKILFNWHYFNPGQCSDPRFVLFGAWINYANVTVDAVALFTSLCPNRHSQQPNATQSYANAMQSPANAIALQRGWHVHTFSMRSYDGPYKYVLACTDLRTGYLALRPLIGTSVGTVTRALFEVFTAYSAPALIQCTRGRRFAAKIVERLISMWPVPIVMVHGSCPTPDGLVERTLVDWLRENGNHIQWTVALRYVQMAFNRATYRDRGRPAFETFFSSPARDGLDTSWMPPNIVPAMRMVEQLELVHSICEYRNFYYIFLSGKLSI